MKRYFFDLLCGDRLLRDFQGSLFRSISHACEHAQLLAVHLQCHPRHDYAGWMVNVYNAVGVELHSVRVPAARDGIVFEADRTAELRPLEAA